MSAIGRHEGVVLLTGDIGTGKTTLCRAIVQQLDRKTFASFMTTPCLSLDDLLANVLVDFGVIQDEGGDSLGPRLPPVADEAVPLGSTLRVFMQSLERLEANAIVLIDDAHSLPIGVLENIASLSEVGHGSSRLQIVLVGRPDLVTLVERSELKPLEQRISERVVLGPLAANEIDAYIKHRLRSNAGARASVRFDERALFVIYELSGGVPKGVNDICDRALSRASQKGTSTIDGDLIECCREDLGLTDLKDRHARHALGMVFVLGLAVVWILLVGVGAAGAMWVFQGAVARTVTRWESVPRLPASPPIQTPGPIAPVEPVTEH